MPNRVPLENEGVPTLMCIIHRDGVVSEADGILVRIPPHGTRIRIRKGRIVQKIPVL